VPVEQKMLNHERDLLVLFRTSFFFQIWLSFRCPRLCEKVLIVKI